MAFISSCPKCQKSVLVPDGHGHDAEVQCPGCFAEYPLGEILATAPPALIVVRPGSMVAAAAAATPAMAAGGGLEGSLFGAHRIEPALHDGEALQFADDAPHGAAAEAIFAEPASGEHPLGHGVETVEGFAEPAEAALNGEVHEFAAEAGENGETWGGNWTGFGGEAARPEGEDGSVGLAEPEEGMENVNFAEITGKAPSVTADGKTILTEPPKKKKRKRETNPIVRFLGMAISGLLAVGVVLLFASWKDIHLPAWLHMGKKTTSQSPAAAKTPAATAPANSETSPTNATPPASSASPTSANASQPSNEVAGGSQGGGSQGADTPATNPKASPAAPKSKPAADGENDNQIAANDKSDKPKEDAGDPDMSNPDSDKPPLGQPDSSSVAPPPSLAPINPKPKADAPNKPETPATEKPKAPVKPDAAKPDAAKPDASDPFSDTPAPVKEKSKTEAKPDTPAPTKPDDSDPFAKPQATAPVVEKPKTETKPGSPAPAKSDVPSKPDATDPFSDTPAPLKEKPKTEAKPDMPAPTKPNESDPFAGPPATAPAVGKPKTETKPDSLAPIKPVTPEKPNIVAPALEKPKVIEKPKIESKPDAPLLTVPAPNKLEPVKPELAKPGLGPLHTATFAASDLDAALKPVAGGNVDTKSYVAWCKLAEVATFASGESAAQKQAIHGLVDKVAANPQAAGAIAAMAKKLLDDKATHGGIVLAGKVSNVASKNGLFGTAIRMEGMPNAVMVFSSHALEVNKGDSVLVLGALVSDPAKNLPGYTGKQPVIVWADFAAATHGSTGPTLLKRYIE